MLNKGYPANVIHDLNDATDALRTANGEARFYKGVAFVLSAMLTGLSIGMILS